MSRRKAGKLKRLDFADRLKKARRNARRGRDPKATKKVVPGS